MADKPTYTELEQKLKEAEQILDALRNHKVDAVIGADQIAMMRLKEVEDELHEQIQISGNRLKEIESIYQNVPIGLCVLDADLKFSRVNSHLAKMHGIAAEKHIDRKVTELLPNLYGDVGGDLRRVIETGEPQNNVELIGKTPARPEVERYWLQHWLPLYSKQDQLIGINMVVREITERKQYEKKLHQLNETLEERVQIRTESLVSYQDQLRSLASQLSKAEEQERRRLATELHDNLGQMLTISKMKIDGLQEKRLPDDITSEIENIQELLSDSLAYSRELISDLKPPPTLDKEDVRATIEWIAKKMKKRYGLDIIVDDDGKPKQTSKEIHTTLLQCVRELLFNVIKHAEVEKAYIKMWGRNNQVWIAVEDKGIGFDPEASLTDSIDNGGFGLFNIRERMDLLDCHIDIESRIGEGTKVTLMAPLKRPDTSKVTARTYQGETVKSTQEAGQIIKVMIVDDHKMVREGFKKIVNAEEDLTVVAEASDGEEAVKVARETSPDIIIMDVNMPRMDGITATQKIKDQMPAARVVGLSLHDNEKTISNMRDAGASAYLTKNEAFKTLSATIRSEAKVNTNPS